jgi:putative transcriptional regulator
MSAYSLNLVPVRRAKALQRHTGAVYSPSGNTTGQLLVATPPLDDPNFDRSVVLMIEHQPGAGAIGVVINRPLAVDVVDGLDDWIALLSEPSVVFSGGPVEPQALIGIAVRGDGWATVDLSGEAPPALDGLRLFSGYSGWSPGQLEAEIDAGAWLVLPAIASDVTCAEPSHLWRTVLRRQGGRLAWIAEAPDDLSAN